MITVTQNSSTLHYANKPLNVADNFASKKTSFDERSESLGNTAIITAKTDILSEKHAPQVAKYRLLNIARKLLTDANVTSPRSKKPHRTRHCHYHVAPGKQNPTIRLSTKDLQSRATIGNVQTCSSVWACPVCASRIAIEKGEEIREAMRWAESENLKPIMVTLTARHHKKMSLEGFKQQFSDAWKWMSNHRKWKDFKKRYGVAHWIANREVTHGANGWHYHMHILLFLDAQTIAECDDMQVIESDLVGHWINALKKQGLEGLPKYALKVTANEAIGEKYLSKLGLLENATTGDLTYELTGSATKESRTIWDILRHASYGDIVSAKLYIEFVEAMTGDNFITWSRGLHGLVNAFIEQTTDEELQEDAASKMRNWLNISNFWWYVVHRAGVMHELIDIAARTRDIDEVREFLGGLYLELENAKRLPERHRGFIPIPYSVDDVSIHKDWKNEISNCHSETKKY